MKMNNLASLFIIMIIILSIFYLPNLAAGMDVNGKPADANLKAKGPVLDGPSFEMNMMRFSEASQFSDEIEFICWQGTSPIAYFGISSVFYIVDDSIIKLEFPNCNQVVPQGINPTGSITNYIIGNDPDKWYTGLNDYTSICFFDMYPGIDLVYSVSGGTLKYEFRVSPGADPNLIQLRYSNVDELNVDDHKMTMWKDGLELTDSGLVAFQNAFQTSTIDCTFYHHSSDTIRFVLGEYDPSKELVIDPFVQYSTFIGGSNEDLGHAIAVEDGYVYITGETNSQDLPIDTTISFGNLESFNCFIMKFSTDGSQLVYTTLLGGSQMDAAYGIAVEDGFAFVTGITNSNDFPTANAFDSSYGYGYDCFVTKLAKNGSTLIYSTYLGGSNDNDVAYDIDVEEGLAYITGFTLSEDFPKVNALDSTIESADCFVTKLAANGSALIYSTFLGGGSSDTGLGITVEDGYAYISGSTLSDDFATINAFDSTLNGGKDCFITKLSPDGSSIIYSTLLGGSMDDEASSIDVEDGYAYLTGITYSTDFAIKNAFDSTHNGNSDCFITKVEIDGLSLVYSTFIGGIAVDEANDISVENGEAYIIGKTTSPDFVTINSYDSDFNGLSDCFVSKLASNGTAMIYSTYYGANSADVGLGIAVENGYAYITGKTSSEEFPVQDAYDSSYNMNGDCFVAKFAKDPPIQPPSTGFDLMPVVYIGAGVLGIGIVALVIVSKRKSKT